MWPFPSVRLNALWRFSVSLCRKQGVGDGALGVFCSLFPSSILFCSGNYGWKGCVREMQSSHTPDVSGCQQPFFCNKKITWRTSDLCSFIPESVEFHFHCLSFQILKTEMFYASRTPVTKENIQLLCCAPPAVCVICVPLLQFIQRFHSHLLKFANQPAVLCKERHGKKIHACIKLFFALSHSVWRAQCSHFWRKGANLFHI